MVFRESEQSGHREQHSYQQTSTHHQKRYSSLSYTKESIEYGDQSRDGQGREGGKKNPHKKSYHPQIQHTSLGIHLRQQ